MREFKVEQKRDFSTEVYSIKLYYLDDNGKKRGFIMKFSDEYVEAMSEKAEGAEWPTRVIKIKEESNG